MAEAVEPRILSLTTRLENSRVGAGIRNNRAGTVNGVGRYNLAEIEELEGQSLLNALDELVAYKVLMRAQAAYYKSRMGGLNTIDPEDPEQLKLTASSAGRNLLKVANAYRERRQGDHRYPPVGVFAFQEVRRVGRFVYTHPVTALINRQIALIRRVDPRVGQFDAREDFYDALAGNTDPQYVKRITGGSVTASNGYRNG